MARTDWLWDSVQAEVAYRTDELWRAGRITEVVQRTRPYRWLRRPDREAKIPEQRDGGHAR